MSAKAERKRYPRRSSSDKTTKKELVFRKTRLSNGIRIVSEEVPFVDSFALGISINAGSREDPIDLPGVAHFIEHATFRRTKHGTSRNLSTKFESVGAYTNAFTAKEFTSYYVRALRSHFNKSATLLSDVVLNNSFIQKEIDTERKIIIEEIKLYQEDPEERIFDFGEKQIFRGHTLANPISGSIDSVRKISAADLKEYYSKYYTPENIIITVAGNISHDRVVKHFENRFGNLKSRQDVQSRIYPIDNQPVRKEIKTNVQQAYLMLGKNLPGINSPDKYPLLALNEIFASGMSSRLQDTLREKKGLAYSLDSEIYFYSDCGTFYINTVLDENELDNAEKTIYCEIDKLLKKGISAAELAKAKEQLKSGAVMDHESMSVRMRALLRGELYGTGPENIESTLEQIDSITSSDIIQSAQNYFSGDWHTIVLLPE